MKYESLSPEDIQSTIKTFIIAQFLDGESVGLEETTPLLELGIIDSLAMVSLIAFMSDQFDTQISDDEIIPENFQHIQSITNLVIRILKSNSRANRENKPNAQEETMSILESYGIERQYHQTKLGDNIHYLRVYGESPTWVILPALGNTSSAYGHILRSILGEQEAIAVDLLGFGLSVSSTLEPTYEDHLESCLDLLTHACESPIVLVGHSAGAMLATEIVRRHPEWVRALVISGFGLIEDAAARAQHMRSLAQDPQTFLEKAFYHPPKLTHQSRQVLLDTFSCPAYNRFLDSASVYAMEHAFDDITVPTLFVSGEQDQIVSKEATLAAHQRVPHAQLEWLARCGHFPPVERPDEFIYVVRNFLASLTN